MIYLCTTFRSEKRTEQNKKRIVLYSNIRTAFFEVIEQLNSFSTLSLESDFKTIPLRLERKI